MSTLVMDLERLDTPTPHQDDKGAIEMGSCWGPVPCDPGCCFNSCFSPAVTCHTCTNTTS